MKSSDTIYIIKKIALSIKNNSLSESNLNSLDISSRYGFDSLEFMQFVAAVETEFQIEFENDVTYEELNDVEYLLKEINRKVKKPVSEKINF